MRLKDLFFQFDKDHSGDITRDEFKAGLKETGIQMSEVLILILIAVRAVHFIVNAQSSRWTLPFIGLSGPSRSFKSCEFSVSFS